MVGAVDAMAVVVRVGEQVLAGLAGSAVDVGVAGRAQQWVTLGTSSSDSVRIVTSRALRAGSTYRIVVKAVWRDATLRGR